MQGIRARLNEQIGTIALSGRFVARDVNRLAMRHVAVFPNLQLAYNRIKKNANTSTMIHLRRLEADVQEDGHLAKANTLHITSAPVKELARLQSYTFFVIARNPYTRLLSAFLSKFGRKDRQYVRRFRYFDLSPAGFHEFVGWLQDGGLEQDKHWDLQSKVLLLPLEKFDVVLRFENYAEEMERLLSFKNLKVPSADTFQLPKGGGTKASPLAHSFYTPEVASQVYRMFEADFDTLSYPKCLPVA